jgi:hypothetical protein
MAIHPGGIKNTFGGHFVLWSLFLPLLTVIFLPMVLPEQSINEAEVRMVHALNIDVDKLTLSANDTFTSAFIISGMVPATEKFFSSGANIQQGFASKWIRGVWLMIYKAIWRLYVLLKVFFVPMLALCIPAAVDGFSVRARKRYRFESYNPIFFYSSMHTAVLIVGLFLFLPLAPVTLSTAILAALLGGLAIAVWITTANFQTGS